VVNRAFAQKYFGTTDVIGQEFRRDDGVLHEIVGLAANSHFGDLRHGPESIAYMPMKPPAIFTLYVRSTLGPAAISQMIEREANSLNSGVYVSGVTTLDALVGDTIVKEKLLGTIGGALALFGLTLAAIGLFGLLNYSVTRRTREIGIRAALGATRPQIYLLVWKDLAAIAIGGIAAGLAGSLLFMRVAHTYLFGVDTFDKRGIGKVNCYFISRVTRRVQARALSVKRFAFPNDAAFIRESCPRFACRILQSQVVSLAICVYIQPQPKPGQNIWRFCKLCLLRVRSCEPSIEELWLVSLKILP
jgi:hypothetical protein